MKKYIVIEEEVLVRLVSGKYVEGSLHRVLGKEQAIRYACILLDIADESQEDFDELLIEQSSKSLWIHFAVRPFTNRRRVRLMKA